MKITLEFTNIENFFTELPRFAALMNFSGQFASFDHAPKKDTVSNLEEPVLPEASPMPGGGTLISGTAEQVEMAQEAGEIAGKTADMLGKKKKAATEKKAAKKKAEEGAQDTPEEDLPASPAPEEGKAAEEPPAAASEEIKDTDVRKMFNRLIKEGHRDAVKEILAGFNAANFSMLDKKHFAAAMKKAKEVLNDESE